MERDVENGRDRVSDSDPVGASAREGEADSNPPARGSAPAGPACPACGSTRYRDLHHDENVRRYQCADLKCMETYSVSARTGAHIERERAAIVPDEGGGDMKCAKCERTFDKQGWLERHEAKCSGGEGKVKKPKKVKAVARLSIPDQPDCATLSRPTVADEILVMLDEREADLKADLEKIEVVRRAIREVSR
jgi:hypothetical protein